MPRKLGAPDPIAAYSRKQGAARKSASRKCAQCGESRPPALIPNSKPTQCAECQRKEMQGSLFDGHHFAGQANDDITIPIPVNDHRAELSVAQQNWPKETLENPDGSPLLAGAAKIRGFADTIIYLIEKSLILVAEMLEMLHAFLEEKLGPKWWTKTEFKQFEPK